MVPSASQLPDGLRAEPAPVYGHIGTFAANSEAMVIRYTNIDDASCLMRYPLGIIPAGSWLDKPLQVDTLASRRWRCRHPVAGLARAQGELPQAVRMSRAMMGLLLSLTVAVAAFNIITSLGMMVMVEAGRSKRSHRPMGLTPRQIMPSSWCRAPAQGSPALLGAVLVRCCQPVE